MKRPRWTLRDMLIVAPVAGLLTALTPEMLRRMNTLGAKTDPTLIVAPIVFGIMAALILVAALGTKYGKPSRQAFRFGFVVVAVAYFMLSSSTWTWRISDGLLTTQASRELAAGVRQEMSGYSQATNIRT